jgi:hypothetical protein
MCKGCLIKSNIFSLGSYYLIGANILNPPFMFGVQLFRDACGELDPFYVQYFIYHEQLIDLSCFYCIQKTCCKAYNVRWVWKLGVMYTINLCTITTILILAHTIMVQWSYNIGVEQMNVLYEYSFWVQMG